MTHFGVSTFHTVTTLIIYINFTGNATDSSPLDKCWANVEANIEYTFLKKLMNIQYLFFYIFLLTQVGVLYDRFSKAWSATSRSQPLL